MTSTTRRAILLAGVATAALAACATATPARRADARPNIIFIMADDLGYADVSCYGRREYQTPAIDSLAAGGMRFLSGYANSPVCSATRTALMTGRYQYRLPVGLEEPLQGPRDLGLPPDHPTLPSLLRDAGYTTALMGKWHLGRLPNYDPLKSGYEHFWGFRDGSIDYFTHDGFFNRPDLWDGANPVETTGYLTELLGDKTLGMLEAFATQDKPFLLSLHFNAPHWPWEGPDDEAEAKRLAEAGKQSLAHFDGGTMETYAKMVVSMDQQIGRVLDTLQRLGMADNTIIVFTSDNGGERFSDTWPFTGKKTELLEGGLRVPLIVRWPGVAKPGSTTDQAAITMDFVPTLLAAGGAAPHPDYPMDGIDLAAAIAGAAPVPRKLYFRYLHLEQQALRDGDWKYLRIAGNTFLFNVAEDPQERGNLKLRHADVYDRLVRDYEAWNATMLPLDPAAMTHGYSGDMLADHFSTPETH
jgi:arylsulfatase A-like enzyme